MIYALIAVSLLAQDSYCFNDDCFPDGSDKSKGSFVELVKKAYNRACDFLSNKKNKSSEQTVTIEQKNDAQFRQLDRSEEQAIVAALKEAHPHVVLLSVCKEHKENHLQGHWGKNRDFFKAHLVQESLNKKYKEELSLLGFSRIVPFCQKYNR